MASQGNRMRIAGEKHAALQVEADSDVARARFITGDRLCMGCGYNLVGQSIAREPHYALLIARCPECGVVAAVQEYPLLGRWAHRWGMVLAALWVVLIVAGWIATGGMVMGLSLAAGEEASRPYSSFIQAVFSAVESQAVNQAAPPGVTPNTGVADTATVETIVIQRSGGAQQVTTLGGFLGGSGFRNWWKSQDPSALLRQAGGWRIGITPEFILMWFFGGLAVLMVGWFWSILLLQLTRRGLLLWAGTVIVLAIGFALIPVTEFVFVEPHWAWIAGRNQLTPPFLGASMVVFAGVLVAGVMTGRSVARLLVRLFLPPRMRHALAGLWTCDGRPLPAPR